MWIRGWTIVKSAWKAFMQKQQATDTFCILQSIYWWNCGKILFEDPFRSILRPIKASGGPCHRKTEAQPYLTCSVSKRPCIITSTSNIITVLPHFQRDPSMPTVSQMTEPECRGHLIGSSKPGLLGGAEAELGSIHQHQTLVNTGA